MNENEEEHQVNSLLFDLINRREDEDQISKEIMKKVREGLVCCNGYGYSYNYGWVVLDRIRVTVGL